jgi:hypothetical protein
VAKLSTAWGGTLKNKYMKYLFSLILICLLFACNRAKQKAKEAINKAGETVGKTVSEFADGVKEGVDQTFNCELILSNDLTAKGLKTGRFIIESDSTANENKLTVYFIFDKDFKETVTAKVFDTKGSEYGRAKLMAEGKAGEAKYFTFLFDKRTDIETRSKIVVE